VRNEVLPTVKYERIAVYRINRKKVNWPRLLLELPYETGHWRKVYGKGRSGVKTRKKTEAKTE
jgi:hypothetical protein